MEDAQEIALRNQVPYTLSREFNAGEKTAGVFVTDLHSIHARRLCGCSEAKFLVPDWVDKVNPIPDSTISLVRNYEFGYCFGVGAKLHPALRPSYLPDFSRLARTTDEVSYRRL